MNSPYVYELFNPEVAAQLKADPELAIVFFANFAPYDIDTDPLHNPDWVRAAPAREASALQAARLSLQRAKLWLKRIQ